jgi:hypothetical protein
VGRVVFVVMCSCAGGSASVGSGGGTFDGCGGGTFDGVCRKVMGSGSPSGGKGWRWLHRCASRVDVDVWVDVCSRVIFSSCTCSSIGVSSFGGVHEFCVGGVALALGSSLVGQSFSR